eukprot:403348960
MSNFNSRSFTIEGGDNGDIALDILNEDKQDVTLKDAIIDLYLNVKIRNSEDIDNYNHEMLKEERDQLKDIDSFVIIEYIKSSIEILLSLKLEEQEKELKKGKDKKETQAVVHNFKSDVSSIVDFFSDQSSYRIEPPVEYENQIQKLENDVRNHIRIEQQLKIHLDNVLQKLEDQEKLQLIDQSQTQDRIKELKKDKERLEELLSLKERESSDLKKKIDSFDANMQSENQSLKKKLEQMEAEYNSKIDKLQKELDEAKTKLKSFTEKRSSQIRQIHTFDNVDEADDMMTLRKKLPDGTETLALMERLEFLENSNKSSQKNRNLGRGQNGGLQTINMSSHQQQQPLGSYVLSSTGSTNNLHQNDLSKFKSMKEMMKIKNDQIKMYKDSYQRVKSKSPSKYQSQEQQNMQLLQNSNSMGNLNVQNHKRSQSQNMTALNIKPQSANLLQQYNNYILKQGNSRTSGTMSLNQTQTMPAGISNENMKYLIQYNPDELVMVTGSEQLQASQGLSFHNSMNMYNPNAQQHPQQAIINQAALSQIQRNNFSAYGTAVYNKKLVNSKQHQLNSMALNSNGSNSNRGGSTTNIQKNKINKATYNELQKQLSQSQIKYSNNITNQSTIPTKQQFSNQQQQQQLTHSQSQYMKANQIHQQQMLNSQQNSQPPSMIVMNGQGQSLSGFNPLIISKNQPNQQSQPHLHANATQQQQSLSNLQLKKKRNVMGNLTGVGAGGTSNMSMGITANHSGINMTQGQIDSVGSSHNTTNLKQPNQLQQ